MQVRFLERICSGTQLTGTEGGRVNGASPAFTVSEMVYTLRVAKAKVVFTLPSALDKTLAAAKQVGIPASHVLLIQGAVDGYRSAQDLVLQGAELDHQPSYQLPPGTSNKTLCGFLNMSSGTTGLPKAVSNVLSLLNIF